MLQTSRYTKGGAPNRVPAHKLALTDPHLALSTQALSLLLAGIMGAQLMLQKGPKHTEAESEPLLHLTLGSTLSA